MGPIHLFLYAIFYFVLVPISFHDLGIYKYGQFSAILLGVYLVFALFFFVVGAFSHRKFTENSVNDPERSFRVLWLRLLVLCSVSVFYVLYKFSGLDYSGILFHGLAFRFFYTKDTNGFLYLIFYVPSILLQIGCVVSIFEKRVGFVETLFFFFLLVFMALAMGQRSIMLPAVFAIAITFTRKNAFFKYAFPLSVLLLAPIVFLSIGYTGMLRFGIVPEFAFWDLLYQGARRFSIIVPNYFIFADTWIEDNKIVFGAHYIAISLLFIPSSVLPFGKPEISEVYFNRAMGIASNSGSNFGALSEFLVNFGIFGVIFGVLASLLFGRLFSTLYAKSRLNINSFVLYCMLGLYPVGFLILSGFSQYSLIKIPLILVLVAICCRLMYVPRKKLTTK